MLGRCEGNCVAGRVRFQAPVVLFVPLREFCADNLDGHGVVVVGGAAA